MITLEVVEIFRVGTEQKQRDPEEFGDELDDLIKQSARKGMYDDQEKQSPKEYRLRHTIRYMDILGVKEYPFTDDWVENKGPKCFVKLRNQEEDILILADYETFVEEWNEYIDRYHLIP